MNRNYSDHYDPDLTREDMGQPSRYELDREQPAGGRGVDTQDKGAGMTPCNLCPFRGCDGCVYQPEPIPGQTDLLDAIEEES